MIDFRRYDSSQRSVKDIINACQLMERCDAHGRSVQEPGRCDSCLEV